MEIVTHPLVHESFVQTSLYTVKVISDTQMDHSPLHRQLEWRSRRTHPCILVTSSGWTEVNPLDRELSHILIKSQAYIPKRRTLNQVLPPLNAYTKSVHAYIQPWSAHACMHFAW